MSMNEGTIGFAGRRTGSVVWTWVVSALAAAALIMSAVALVRTRDQGPAIGEAAREPLVVTSAQALWDAGKLEAMRGRLLAESVRAPHGFGTPWDAGKLEAMRGRLLAG